MDTVFSNLLLRHHFRSHSVKFYPNAASKHHGYGIFQVGECVLFCRFYIYEEIFIYVSLSNLLHPKLANMSDETPSSEPKVRTVGGTEYSWCKAVPIGTGITVLGLLLSKPPNISLIQTTLHNLQNSHPILRSNLHFDTTTNTFSYLIPSTSPHLQIQPFDLQSTSRILQTLPNSSNLLPFPLIVEHELNNHNTWRDPAHPLYADKDVLYTSVYTLSEEPPRWALTLRLHTSACDRTAAVSLLRELLVLVSGNGKEEEGIERESGEVNLGIEQLIPPGKANKPFWARGVDMLGYSLNSFRLANLDFRGTDSPRSSQILRLQMNPQDTEKLLAVSYFLFILYYHNILLFTVTNLTLSDINQ
jgi:hypothetical protein